MALTLPFLGSKTVVVEELPRTGNPLIDSMTRRQCLDRLAELRAQYRAGVHISARDVTLIGQLRKRAGV